LSTVFCLLALQASANSISRRIASERERLAILLLGPAFNSMRIYRFFSVALAALRRAAFAVTVGFDAAAGDVKQHAT